MPTATHTARLTVPEPRSTRWMYIAIGALVLVLLVGLALYLWLLRPDPNLVRVKELGQQLFSQGAKLTDDQRREMFQELREASEKLSPRDREQLRAEVGGMFRQRMQQEIDNYFELPVSQRQQYLDAQIQRMEQMRRDFESRRGQAGGPGGPGFGRGPDGGPGQGRRPGGDDQMTGRRRMLDETTPEQREKFTRYMQDMAQRRTELGLPPMGPPWGGRPGSGTGR